MSSAPMFRRLLLAVAVASLVTRAGVAAPMSWVPDADGFWDVVANWSVNPILPGAADDVTLDVGGATVRTITHRSDTTTINSLTSQENFALTGGTLTLTSASDIAGSFTHSAGTLTLTGPTGINGVRSCLLPLPIPTSKRQDLTPSVVCVCGNQHIWRGLLGRC